LGSVGLRIAAEREKAGLTQVQLGERCGEHPVSIARLESNRREPQLGTLLKLAAILGISVADLSAGIAWNVDRQRFEIDS
jgi:transcriptional regulator with XRE-family HTH domain